jgi:Ca2+-binding RTX toxin-like protein
VARHRTTPRTRAGLLAGAAAVAALAFPGIANATVNSAVNGTALTVTSTADDPITVISDAQGHVKVNNADPGTGEFDAGLLTSITVTGGPGANTIDLSGVTANAFSKVTAVTANGGAGNDTITGSQLADRLIGGDDDDDVSGLAGNDTIVWNPGDDTDRNEGGDGRDTIEVNGGGGPETFTLNPSATAPRLLFERTPPTPNPPGNFALDIGTAEQLDLDMNGGDDTFTSNGAIAALGFDVDVDGGDGNDSIDGSDGADVLTGGNNDDRIVPDDNPPNTRDVAHGDAGNDLIVWNGGDDDDLNDGGDGTDTSQVNGATANETFTVKPGANGHIIFDRTAPTPTPIPGFFNIDISTTETLDLNMNAGDDTVTADTGVASLALDVDGGDGNDRIDGSDAADNLSGGNGDDTIVPDDNPATTTDVAHGDAGNDTTIWNPGDDDDLNEGGDGDDTSVVNGGGGDEDFTVKPSATAGRVRLDRVNPAPFFVDIGTTEHLQLNAGGGDDTLKGDKGLARLIESELNGDDGDDVVRGTDGEDQLNGGAGRDLIRARDRAEDLVDCGTGFDIAKVDKRDFVRGCNIIIGGHLKVRVVHTTLFTDNGLAALRLKCVGTKRCKGTVRLRHDGRTLATKRFNIKTRAKTVHLKLNRRGLRFMADAPAKGRKVKLQVDASDARGNGWRSAARLTLKP